jgi:hypothetical protein
MQLTLLHHHHGHSSFCSDAASALGTVARHHTPTSCLHSFVFWREKGDSRLLHWVNQLLSGHDLKSIIIIMLIVGVPTRKSVAQTQVFLITLHSLHMNQEIN